MKTRQQIADAVGVSVRMISHYESGTMHAPDDRLEKMLAAMKADRPRLRRERAHALDMMVQT